jgi:hypothetical protein
MNIKDKYKEFYKIPFPSDLSDNEKLADIRIEMLLYVDFVAGDVGKYICGREVDAPCLRV